MQVEALSIFCDVVRHQSFSRGTAASAVSQSAASQAVRQIEKDLGTQLIDRPKRPWRLTEDGKLFFQGSQELVERYHELEDTIRRRQRSSGYTVRLASIYSVRLHDLSGYLDRFRASVPGADVEVAYMHPDQVYEQVLNDQCDLGLLSFANPCRELTAIPWEDQSMVVASLPDHRLVGASAGTLLNPSDLSGEPFVTFDRGLPCRWELDRFLRRHDADVRIVAEFDNIENIKQAIEDGAGIAILPEPTLRREVESRTLVKVPLRQRPDVPPLVRPVSIIHRRRQRLNPAVLKFITLLLEQRPIDADNGVRASAQSKVGAAV